MGKHTIADYGMCLESLSMTLLERLNVQKTSKIGVNLTIDIYNGFLYNVYNNWERNYIMSAIYNKENILKEFDVAKQKDFKLSKKKTDEDKENDIHKNRIKFCKEHAEFFAKSPESYEHGLKINFANLLKAYESENPRDHFYQVVFGKTYADKMAEQENEADLAIGEEEAYYKSRRKQRGYKR